MLLQRGFIRHALCVRTDTVMTSGYVESLSDRLRSFSPPTIKERMAAMVAALGRQGTRRHQQTAGGAHKDRAAPSTRRDA
jgi:hypothetical protein